MVRFIEHGWVEKEVTKCL